MLSMTVYQQIVNQCTAIATSEVITCFLFKVLYWANANIAQTIPSHCQINMTLKRLLIAVVLVVSSAGSSRAVSHKKRTTQFLRSNFALLYSTFDRQAQKSDSGARHK